MLVDHTGLVHTFAILMQRETRTCRTAEQPREVDLFRILFVTILIVVALSFHALFSYICVFALSIKEGRETEKGENKFRKMLR